MAVSAKVLANFAQQMATSIEAGVPLARTLSLLSQEGPSSLRRALNAIHDAVVAGTPLGQAMGNHRDVFPPLFIALVGVGEYVGSLERVLRALAHHYELRYELKRSLISFLIYPAFMYAAAGAIVTLMIIVRDGIVGNDPTATLRGLRFAATWYGAAAAIVVGYSLMRSRLGGIRAVDEILLAVPIVGKAIRNLESAQFCWILQVCLEAGIGVLDGLRLAIDSSRNAAFRARLAGVPEMIANGTPVSEALSKTGFFRTVVLAAIEVGESSGKLPETLDRLSKNSLEEAEFSLRMLAKAAGWMIWAVVALLIISIIFQIASQYVSLINNLSSGNF